MAILKNGGGPRFRGKLGRTVYYELNGVYIARQVGFTDKKATIPQQTARLATKIVSEFLNPVEPFLNIGFELFGKETRTNSRCQAFKYNRMYAVTGEYPEIGIDFSKALFTMGTMASPTNVAVQKSDTGIKYTWDTELKIMGINWSDQAMMLAYFATLGKVVYLSGGAQRYIGTDQLHLLGVERGHVAETYFSFVSNDRSSICNSIYTGQIEW
jgi:hypothetical protein